MSHVDQYFSEAVQGRQALDYEKVEHLAKVSWPLEKRNFGGVSRSLERYVGRHWYYCTVL